MKCTIKARADPLVPILSCWQIRCFTHPHHPTNTSTPMRTFVSRMARGVADQALRASGPRLNSSTRDHRPLCHRWRRQSFPGRDRWQHARRVPHNLSPYEWTKRTEKALKLLRVRGDLLGQDVLVAIPRMLPSGFWRAVIVAVVNALKMQSGTEDPAKSSAADVKRCNASVLSKHTFNISLVHPPGPGGKLDGASLKHVSNIFALRQTSAIGTHSGNSLQLLLRSACAQFLQCRLALGCERGACEFQSRHSLEQPSLGVHSSLRRCVLNDLLIRKASSMNTLQCTPPQGQPVHSCQPLHSRLVCAATWLAATRTLSKLDFCPPHETPLSHDASPSARSGSIPADGLAWNADTSSTWAPDVKIRPPKRKNPLVPTMSQRLLGWLFDDLRLNIPRGFLTHVNRQMHACSINHRHPRIHTATFSVQEFLNSSGNVVSWESGQESFPTQPLRQLLSVFKSPQTWEPRVNLGFMSRVHFTSRWRIIHPWENEDKFNYRSNSHFESRPLWCWLFFQKSLLGDGSQSRVVISTKTEQIRDWDARGKQENRFHDTTGACKIEANMNADVIFSEN